MKLIVATYNIHACIGRDGVYDPHRIVEVIRGINADVIALQEVEHHFVDDLDLLDFIAQQTGMFAIAGPTMYRETRHYGNAILSKHPVESFELVDLSQQQREPRGAVVIQLKIEHTELMVVASHFGLKPKERQYQARSLLALIKSAQAENVILMGDFNEWFPWSYTLGLFKAFFGVTPRCRSFPSSIPLFALDRIWLKSHSAIERLYVEKTDVSRIASDHLPLVADIRF